MNMKTYLKPPPRHLLCLKTMMTNNVEYDGKVCCSFGIIHGVVFMIHDD